MNTSENNYKCYLQIVTKLIKEYALEAKNDKLPDEILSNRDYLDGYIMGFHRIISLVVYWDYCCQGFQWFY